MRQARSDMSIMLSRAALLALLVLLSGCAARSPLNSVSVPETQWLLDGSALEGVEPGSLELPEDGFLEVTPEMKEWVRRRIGHYVDDRFATRDLVVALTHGSGLGIEYDPGATLTARETFVHHRANCLSFTALVVVLAREMGLRAQFNEVEVPPIWDMRSRSSLVLYKHVNAIVHTPLTNRKVVDLNIEEYDASYIQHEITDGEAEAQYYNNRAMELLNENNHLDALRYLAKAISIEPGISYLWSNLGSLYRRTGNLEAAELAFRTALDHDPSDLVAISNAARLYEEKGETEIARRLTERARRFRMENPYFRYHMALEALSAEKIGEAMNHTRAAIDLYPKEHRFHFLLGVLYRQSGNSRLAEESMQKAIALSSDLAQSSRYRSKMEMLLSANHR